MPAVGARRLGADRAGDVAANVALEMAQLPVVDATRLRTHPRTTGPDDQANNQRRDHREHQQPPQQPPNHHNSDQRNQQPDDHDQRP